MIADEDNAAVTITSPSVQGKKVVYALSRARTAQDDFHCGSSAPYVSLTRFDKPVGTLLLLWPTLTALWIA
ncbi:MAG: hypothetical protein ACXW14_04050, partial [Burkholderiaceae bacterium]